MVQEMTPLLKHVPDASRNVMVQKTICLHHFRHLIVGEKAPNAASKIYSAGLLHSYFPPIRFQRAFRLFTGKYMRRKKRKESIQTTVLVANVLADVL
jgi:hypothetical protein